MGTQSTQLVTAPETEPTSAANVCMLVAAVCSSIPLVAWHTFMYSWDMQTCHLAERSDN